MKRTCICVAFLGILSVALLGCADEYSPDAILGKKTDEFVDSMLKINSMGVSSGISDTTLKSKAFHDAYFNCLATVKPDLTAANMPRLMKKFNSDRGSLTPMELDVMNRTISIIDQKYKDCAAQMRAAQG